MLQIALFLAFLSAESAKPQDPAKLNWETWRQKTLQEALTSPTSFLNAYALQQAESGETLYLEAGATKETTRWVKQAPPKPYAQAAHMGAQIRLQVNQQTKAYLNNEPEHRRYDFKTPSGIVAEVVYGKRNKKMWTYLYDPKQIEQFTGFEFYKYNPKAVVHGVFKKQKSRFISYKTVQGDPTRVNHVGNVSFHANGKDFYLPAYNWQPQTETKDYIALIFTDETKGKETYPGGRELVIDMPNGLVDGVKMVLDFNKTLNFYCAHSPFWHCPVGLQKHIKTKLKAGEKLPKKKIM